MYKRKLIGAIDRDRVLHDKTAIIDLFKAGARVYICGSSQLAKGCNEAVVQIYSAEKGASKDEAEEWLQTARASRFATDIFG